MSEHTPDRMLRAGETCWTIARAGRVAVIIDAADYFAMVREAIQKARHSVLLIGWDFDTRIALDRPDDDARVPNRLGKLLDWAIKEQPGLQIHVLRWNLGAINELGRGTTPLAILDWMTDDRIHFKLDAAHPAGSAHHQKIVVIDDALAFCGGIDMTGDRWDTREHLDEHPLRVRPTTKRHYPPWHDVSTAVDGRAAQALGELARERWRCATGETLTPPTPTEVWPEELTPLFRDVDVAIARTAPEYDGRAGVQEIEALYLEAIRSVRQTLYIESQYFASLPLADAMAKRLSEPDGPEIVLVNPDKAQGWLEEEVMGSSRAMLLDRIATADRHGRFRLYTPVTEQRQPIYVHAKVMVVDDRLLKVGSSNLNNRSMGFDTECDLAMEASPDPAEDHAVRRSILSLRNDLVAEHLGVTQDVLEASLERWNGSLVRAIEELRTTGRSLVPFEAPDISDAERAVFEENALLDPERPTSRWRSARRTLSNINPFGRGQ
ncbi:phospholipase [Paracoccus liaowanqingii]|uniref:Phospholipase D n=1 Tax=Paracoccus liaowanqingii TaxID=2560053 RepID=A0A4Z1CB78_9RHOB|nr:phospholipase D-like domain-containing protein [Paracoccus liaowanqingii]TGN61812.1 phospholipase [Paracoccus liaowanqingii]